MPPSGPVVAAAKKSLLKFIPHIIPLHDDKVSIVLFLNTAISKSTICRLEDANGLPLVTSVYDSETAHIVPAILSDPLMAVSVDLVTNEDAVLSFTRVPDYCATN